MSVDSRWMGSVEITHLSPGPFKPPRSISVSTGWEKKDSASLNRNFLSSPFRVIFFFVKSKGYPAQQTDGLP